MPPAAAYILRFAPTHSQEVYTVLFGYTGDVAQHTADVELAAQNMVDAANQLYRNSQTGIAVKGVGVVPFIEYHEAVSPGGKTAGDAIADHSVFMSVGDGVMDDIHVERDRTQANICVLLTHTWAVSGGM